jgi:twitching motility protein PilU
VILIGEIRDAETMEHAIAFAETGHLCLGTLHANSAEPDHRAHHQLLPRGAAHAAADGPVGQPARIVSQRLVRRQDGNGRSAAIEILLNTPTIAEKIFQGQFHEIKAIMASRASWACAPSTGRCSSSTTKA